MINIYEQLLSFFFSIIYGTIIYLIDKILIKYTQNYKKMYIFLILLFYYNILTVFYFKILYLINDGIINIYFVITVFVTYFIINIYFTKKMSK